MPDKYKIKLIINCIYSKYAFDPEELLDYILYCLYNEKSQERYNEIVQKLQELNLIDKEGLVTLYREYDETSEDIDTALSWSYDRDDALFFALRRRFFNLESIPYLIEIRVKPESILEIMIEDREHEIVLIPESDKIVVSNKEVIMSKEEHEEFLWRRKIVREKPMKN